MLTNVAVDRLHIALWICKDLLKDGQTEAPLRHWDKMPLSLSRTIWCYLVLVLHEIGKSKRGIITHCQNGVSPMFPQHYHRFVLSLLRVCKQDYVENYCSDLCCGNCGEQRHAPATPLPITHS